RCAPQGLRAEAVYSRTASKSRCAIAPYAPMRRFLASSSGSRAGPKVERSTVRVVLSSMSSVIASPVDEMQEEAAALRDENPDEFLVNPFSTCVLMPIVGSRGASARRGTDMHTATPAQMLAVANNFGVGYTTLVTHLAYGVQEIGGSRARELL